MDMQSVMATILWMITFAVINCYLLTFSLACRRSSRLLSPYFQHGHHPLEDHIGCHLFTVSMHAHFSLAYIRSHRPHILTFSLAIVL